MRRGEQKSAHTGHGVAVGGRLLVPQSEQVQIESLVERKCGSVRDQDVLFAGQDRGSYSGHRPFRPRDQGPKQEEGMSSSEEELERNASEDEDVSEDEVPEEEDDVSEDEDEVQAAPVKKRKGADPKPKPKKRRKPVNKFIEEEADVDEDEEEEEDDDEADFYRSERMMAEEAHAAHQYRYEPQDRARYDEGESAEAIVNRIKKRHQQSRKQYDEDEEGGDVMQSEVAQQSLLPSIQDPRMWVFKCKVRLLINKHAFKQSRELTFSLNVLTAWTRAALSDCAHEQVSGVCPPRRAAAD